MQDTEHTESPAATETPGVDAPASATQETEALDGGIEERIREALDAREMEFTARLEAATGHRTLESLQEAQQQKAAEYQERLDAAHREAAEQRGRYEQAAIKAAVLAAAGEAIKPEMVFDMLAGKAAIAADGTVTVGGKPAQEAVKALLDENPFLAKPNGPPGGGAPQMGSGNFAMHANPWLSGQFNLTEQSRIARQDPVLASRMKAAAGFQ